MTDIVPVPNWSGVRQLETDEYAKGGLNGNMNEQATSLAARTELLKNYTPLPYESGKSYKLNERVTLANGNIVKSTVPNNTNDPNADMTGWEVQDLIRSNNLSDVPDKATARNNLEVMSATEVNTAISNAILPTIPNATETVAGKAKIATTAMARAGSNDTDFLTAKKLRDALNATGFAPVYACRAWVNFNGTGTIAIRASGNVSSITDNGNGDYTINFTTVMPDALYIPFLSHTGSSSNTLKLVVTSATEGGTPTLKTASAIRVNYGNIDLSEVYIGIIR